MNRFIVSKFGGTSMGTAAAMTAAAKIIAAKPLVRVIVVSATSGTTNQLLKIYDLKNRNSQTEAGAEQKALSLRHLSQARELLSDEETLAQTEAILLELDSFVQSNAVLNDQALDSLLAMGERLSSVLFSQALRNERKKSEVLDARLCVRTDSRFGKAEVDPTFTRELCNPIRKKIDSTEILYVTQGFIGANAENQTTTLGRGGSDYSAALFAEALGAGEVEIWTDVPACSRWIHGWFQKRKSFTN